MFNIKRAKPIDFKEIMKYIHMKKTGLEEFFIIKDYGKTKGVVMRENNTYYTWFENIDAQNFFFSKFNFQLKQAA